MYLHISEPRGRGQNEKVYYILCVAWRFSDTVKLCILWGERFLVLFSVLSQVLCFRETIRFLLRRSSFDTFSCYHEMIHLFSCLNHFRLVLSEPFQCGISVLECCYFYSMYYVREKYRM